MISASQIKTISGNSKAKHVAALAEALDRYEPHVQAHVLAQVMHETGGLVYDREIWGPTEAQKKYEGRKDLGNTQKGDGSKFRGYGLIQLTGRRNVTAFQNWCENEGLDPPDFLDKPALIASDPWAALTVVWYWEVGNPSRKSLTSYADVNDIEMITRRVNGGLNGYEDRLRYYDRAALVLLGYGPTEVLKFQKANKLEADGVSGPRTRAALHAALLRQTKGALQREETAVAPVVDKVEKEVPVPVAPPAAVMQTTKTESRFRKYSNRVGSALTGAGLTGLGSSTVFGLEWQTLAVWAGIILLGLFVVLVLGPWAVRQIKKIASELDV